MKTLLRLSTMLFVALVLVVPVTLYSANEAPQDGVGHVVLGSGQVVARAADGAERRIQRRSPIYAGDTIVAGSNAFVQMRFSDGGLVSLRSGSEFRIDDYQFKGKEDGSEKATFSLLKGGLRTISGRIGKTNKANYRMNTPVATIGIRGTHYGVRLCVGDCGPGIPDGWYIGVLEGSIVFTVDGKEYVCNAGEYYHIPLNGGSPVKQVSKGVLFGGFPGDGEVKSGNGWGRHKPGHNEPPISGPKRDTQGGTSVYVAYPIYDYVPVVPWD
jgi:hypothetical protein